jgi:hypothetical protein
LLRRRSPLSPTLPPAPSRRLPPAAAIRRFGKSAAGKAAHLPYHVALTNDGATLTLARSDLRAADFDLGGTAATRQGGVSPLARKAPLPPWFQPLDIDAVLAGRATITGVRGARASSLAQSPARAAAADAPVRLLPPPAPEIVISPLVNSLPSPLMAPLSRRRCV